MEIFWLKENIYKEKSKSGGSHPPKFASEAESELESESDEGANLSRATFESKAGSESSFSESSGKKITSPEGGGVFPKQTHRSHQCGSNLEHKVASLGLYFFSWNLPAQWPFWP